MKYAIIQLDGASDQPLDELDGRTPMEAARTPNLDRLAERGRVGKACLAPEDMDCGSDVANLALLGYDPHRFYTGRAPLECASRGIPVEGRDVAFRVNLVSVNGESMLDHSGGSVTNDEARQLIDTVQRLFTSSDARTLYPGVGYRHLMVWRDGPDSLRCTPPHNIVGQSFMKYMPEGDRDQSIRRKMWDSYELLDEHEVNKQRRDEGKLAANMIWPWGPGRAPSLPLFSTRWGVQGSMIAAVDLMKGLGRIVGLHTPDVPGATGYVETNYAGKATTALSSLREGRDFAMIHIEGPDEAGHQGDHEAKVWSIEQIDNQIVGPVVEGLGQMGAFRLLALPDHSTPVKTRKHGERCVPFLLYDSLRDEDGRLPFDERGMMDTKFRIPEGHRLIEELFAE